MKQKKVRNWIQICWTHKNHFRELHMNFSLLIKNINTQIPQILSKLIIIYKFRQLFYYKIAKHNLFALIMLATQYCHFLNTGSFNQLFSCLK